MNRLAAAALFLGLAASPVIAQEVGEVGVDWLGNDIIVEAFKDPQAPAARRDRSPFATSTSARAARRSSTRASR
jgi:hypothetical protein